MNYIAIFEQESVSFNLITFSSLDTLYYKILLTKISRTYILRIIIIANISVPQMFAE